MVEDRKIDYVNSKRLDKPLVALDIIRVWRNQDPPGRFLKMDEKSKKWIDVGDKKAREKTSQALREKAPLIRQHLEDERRSKGHDGGESVSRCMFISIFARRKLTNLSISIRRMKRKLKKNQCSSRRGRNHTMVVKKMVYQRSSLPETILWDVNISNQTKKLHLKGFPGRTLFEAHRLGEWRLNAPQVVEVLARSRLEHTQSVTVILVMGV